MTQFNNATESQDDYVIKEASLSSDRGVAFSVDLRKVISDIEIFEHLDKPYLTGQVAFSDNFSVLERIDLQGGELFTLRIQSSQNSNKGIEILKKFRVENLLRSVKTNDQNETVFLKLVEDCVFSSSLKNVNRSYKGTPASIVTSIMKDFVGKEMRFHPDAYQGEIKVIIPNLHPFEAAMWVKNRSTNVDGLPYFFFSVFADNELRFFHLGEMLRQTPINLNHPYTNWQSASSRETGAARHFVIQNYDYQKTDNLLRLIRAGAIGAKHEFYDSLQGTSEAVNFNSTIDVFDVLTNNDYFSSDQNQYKHAPGLKIDDEFIDNYNSVVHSQISSSGAYKGNNTEFRTLYESEEASGHMKKIVGRSLKNFMTKAPISIGVSGRDFIYGNPDPQGDQHYSIGNTIRILFFDSTADLDARPRLDTKKSGDYIIFAARHMFKIEKYDVQLLCTKLADYKEDVKVM